MAMQHLSVADTDIMMMRVDLIIQLQIQTEQQGQSHMLKPHITCAHFTSAELEPNHNQPQIALFA